MAEASAERAVVDRTPDLQQQVGTLVETIASAATFSVSIRPAPRILFASDLGAGVGTSPFEICEKLPEVLDAELSERKGGLVVGVHDVDPAVLWIHDHGTWDSSSSSSPSSLAMRPTVNT